MLTWGDRLLLFLSICTNNYGLGSTKLLYSLSSIVFLGVSETVFLGVTNLVFVLMDDVRVFLVVEAVKVL